MGQSNHLVSIVMPVYNGANLLMFSLNSIKDQDYPNLEMIVVIDGSTDNSEEILTTFSNSWSIPLKVLKHPGGNRQGIASSYQLAIDHCQGKYIAFLEQDDVWQVNKISEQVKVFEQFKNVGVVFSDVYKFDVQGKAAATPFKTMINRPPSGRPFNPFLRLLWGDFVSTFSNIMVRRNLVDLQDILAEPEGFQDWMLLVLLSQRCKFYHSNKTRIYWRQRQDSFYGKFRQDPKYISKFRNLRKLALKNSMSKIWHENQNSNSGHHISNFLIKQYWYFIIHLLSFTEGIADTLNRSFIFRKISSQRMVH